MNTSIKTLAYALAASMLLLACNDTTGPSIDNEDSYITGGEAKQPSAPNAIEGEPEPSNIKQPNDRPAQFADDSIQIWIEEQLVSKSGEKRLVRISEMYPLDFESRPQFTINYNHSTGEGDYFISGRQVSVEEFMDKREEYSIQVSKPNYGKRDLSIPGIIISDDLVGWSVLMTAEQIVELSEKYGELLIGFHWGVTPD